MLPLKMPVAPFLALLNRDMKGANLASASPLNPSILRDFEFWFPQS